MFRNTGANAFANNQMRLAYEDKRDLYCRMSSEMMSIGIGRVVFPADEIADLSTAPRAPRAAQYMAAMGLWRPQMGPGDPGPVPSSSCSSCMKCQYCFSGGRFSPE